MFIITFTAFVLGIIRLFKKNSWIKMGLNIFKLHALSSPTLVWNLTYRDIFKWQTKKSVHMVSFTIAYVVGSIVPSIPVDRLSARRACRCSGQNGRLSECTLWNKCPRSNFHCRWTGMSTLAPSASRSAHPGTTYALFPNVFGWQKS